MIFAMEILGKNREEVKIFREVLEDFGWVGTVRGDLVETGEGEVKNNENAGPDKLDNLDKTKINIRAKIECEKNQFSVILLFIGFIFLIIVMLFTCQRTLFRETLVTL